MEEKAGLETAWSDDDSRIFMELAEYFVPERAAQFATIAALIPSRDGPVHIMDIGCGAGALAETLLANIPQSIVHGIDGSSTMLRQAREQLARFGSRFEGQQHDLCVHSWRAPAWPVHAAVSSLALHHLDDQGKEQVYADVYDALEPDGVLIIADVIEPASIAGRALAADAWDEAVREQSLSHHGTLLPFERFQEAKWNLYRYPDPADKPAPLVSHFTWLKEAGFTDPDLFWFKAGHAVFGARKV